MKFMRMTLLVLCGTLAACERTTPEAMAQKNQYPIESLGLSDDASRATRVEILRDKVTGCEWLIFSMSGVNAQPRNEVDASGQIRQRCTGRKGSSNMVGSSKEK